MQQNTYVINLKDVIKNYDLALSLAGGKPVIPMLKADGYGMGAKALAETLSQKRGVKLFAVSRFSEAAPLLSDEYSILVLTPPADSDEARFAAQSSVTAAVDSRESAALLNAAAGELGVTAKVHIAVDTGFGRYGFAPDDMEGMLGLKALASLKVTGAYTHLYAAFDKDISKSLLQLKIFKSAADKLEAQFGPLTKHIANTCALLRDSRFVLDAVRPGSLLCGRAPITFGKPLTPVGTLCCPITEIRSLPRGHNIGYGGIFKLKRDSRVAVINAGSADGILRKKDYDTFRLIDIARYGYNLLKLIGGGSRLRFEVNGKRAPALGRIALTNTMLDVTDIPCRAGDIARLKLSPLTVDGGVKREYIYE